MPDVNWTPAQAAAIADRGGTLLVSAAAGSGKTAVLAERAVSLITDPHHPAQADRLLIVTFTNAAAAELRARIAQRLAQAVRQDPANAHLRRQRMLLQRAPVCTIDAFCLDLLRRHFSALDIPPDFQPADVGSLRALRDAALAETLEERVQDADFCAFADLYGRGRSDAAAGQAVEQLYDFLQALPDPDAARQRFLQPWQAENGFADTAWCEALLAQAARSARAVAAGLQAAARWAAQDQAEAEAEAAASRKSESAQAAAAAKARDKFAEPRTRLEQALAFYQQAAQLAACPRRAQAWAGLWQLLLPYRQGVLPLPGFKGMRKRLAGAHKTEIKAVADQAARTAQQLLDSVCAPLDELEADRCTALPLLAALARAEQAFAARYYAKKQEKKLLDFSDFEHLALRLLQRPDGSRTPLCAQISAGFDAVMVDEYQDTNALQDALYTCLAHPAGDNLFFVGDIKQSIYRFRQAEPAVFAARQAAYPPLPGGAPRPQPAQPAAPAQLALDANFRSAPAVVAGVNDLFALLMTPDRGGVAYGAGQRLVCGAPGDYSGLVEAALLQAEDAEGEARWLAEHIRALVDQKTPVRCPGGQRPLQYEDCCILLATRGRFGVYAQALAQAGIPSYADSADDLLSAPHLRPLLALLQVIDNPARNIELAAAMRSVLFGFTDDDLLRLRAAQRGRSLYGALVAAAEAADGSAFAQKCRGFYARLGQLRRLSRSLPIDQLLEEIFASTGYLAAVGAGANGARRRDEVRRFAAWAAGAGAGGLGALLRAIDATEAAGGLIDAAPGKSKPGCVSIMTIHRSKGLQFPAVFLGDTAHRFNLDDTRRPVLLHRALGMGLSLRGAAGLYSTAARLAIRQTIHRETLGEQLRLLYVALTRAQDILCISIPLPKPAETAEKAAAALAAGLGDMLLDRAACFADWLVPALLQHPDGGVLRAPSAAQGTGQAAVPLYTGATGRIHITCTQAPPPPAQPGGARPGLPTAPPDPALVQRIAASFAWRYPAQAETEIPAKVSVTAIVHKSEATTLERPGFLSADGMTAAERGTALHSFLEHADLAALAAGLAGGPAALRAALAAENQRQQQLRLVAPQVAAQLDEEKLAVFVQSEAFARMAAARQVLREYDFITGLPASAVLAAQQYGAPTGNPAPPPPGEDPLVMVQGIADVLLVFDDHLELLDYKTDRRKTPADYLAAYRPQLNLYARAIEKRFAPRKVTFKGIYSFDLGRLIPA